MAKTPPHKVTHPAKKKTAALNAAGRAELARLRNIESNYYSDAGNDSYLKKLALRAQNGGSVNYLEGQVRAGKAASTPLNLRAGQTVNAELNPQVSAAKNYESGLQNMYSQLAASQQAAQQGMQQQQQSSAAKVGANYDQLASNVASDFRSGRENTSDELARLGLNNGGVSDQNSESLQSLLTGLAQSGKANAASVQDLQGGAYNNLMSLLGSESANTGATLRAASSQNRGSLEASRAGKVNALYGQLSDQQKAQQAQAAQQRFLNRITGAKLGSTSDLQRAQALQALGTARQKIVDSKRPTVVKKPKIQ